MLGILKALRTTVRHLPQKTFTVQYPEERVELPERSRGLFAVVVDPLSDEARCRACTLCETNCPVQVIRVDYRSRYELPALDEGRLAQRRLASQGPVDPTPVTEAVAACGGGRVPLAGTLRRLQETYGYLPRRALDELAVQTGISRSEIYGLASSSDDLRLSPPGQTVVEVCRCAACHVAGARRVADALEDAFGLTLGSVSDDGRLSLGHVAGTVACARPPVVLVNGDPHCEMTPRAARMLAADLTPGEDPR